MKKLILFFCLITLIACKESSSNNNAENSETKNTDRLSVIKGEFILFDDAAIIQTNKEIYGVIIDSKAEELNKMVASYKKEETDMIPVEVRGKITDKKDDKIQWQHKIEIVEILHVFEPKENTNNTIKIGKE